MRIGELAAQAGVSVQAVHSYERRGLLARPARQPSGYREPRLTGPEEVKAFLGAAIERSRVGGANAAGPA
jgi:hypothetical protein